MNSLGYVAMDPDEGYADATYRLSFQVPHSATSLEFLIRGSGLQTYPNEGWGIDNVRVTLGAGGT